MTAIDFPNSPTTGQLFTVGDVTWEWTGSVWQGAGTPTPGPGVATGGSDGQVLTKTSSTDYETAWEDLPESAAVISSATAPTNTSAIWFNTETGVSYVYYDGFWTSIAGSSGAPIISDTAPTSPVLGMQWFNSSTGKSYLYFSDAWIEVDSNGTAAQPSGNVIINGAFDFWQRGTSGFTGSFVYTADRVVNDTPTVVSRSTDVPVESGTSYSMRHAATTAAAVNRFSVELPRVGYSAPFNTGTTWTLSFYAKASAARNITTFLSFRNGIIGASELIVADVSTVGTATTTWQRFTQTFTIPSGSLTSSNLFSLVVTAAAGASMDFFITGVQLEAGAVATPFKRNAPSIQAELAACQRYYFRAYGGQVFSVLAPGITFTTTGATAQLKLPVSMRVSPTSVEFSNLCVFNGLNNSALLTALTLANFNPDASATSCVLTATYPAYNSASQPIYLGTFSSLSPQFVAVSAEL